MYCLKCGYDNPEDEKICKACSAPMPVIADLPPEVKTSNLAIWSFVLSLMGLFTLMVTGLPAIICGIIGLVKISGSKGRLKGIGFSITGIVLPILYFCLILPILMAILMPALGKVRILAQKQMCATNIESLGTAISYYVNDYNAYPPADRWCDELIEKEDVTAEQFICAEDENSQGLSSYAFNINLAGKNPAEVPADTVLLFETTPAKNPAGGPELLITEKHKGGGSNIVFTDYSVKFVAKEELGTLKWEAE
ncbi:MAG: DUF4190 domain-containing protein [Phycisphaerales bacterium]